MKPIVFSLVRPVAYLLRAFLCLPLTKPLRIGFSVQSFTFRWEQIYRMAIQICSLVPSLFSRPGHLSGIVRIVAGGGAQPRLKFVKLLQVSALLNVNLAILNGLPWGKSSKKIISLSRSDRERDKRKGAFSV